MDDRIYSDYERDPQFRALVDLMYYHLRNLNTTPSELRAAVLMATIKLERERPPQPIVMPSEEHHGTR